MLKAWAQLVRLPNVFTAPADVLAGFALGFHALHGDVPWVLLILFCLISCCFYMGGMIINDVVDIAEDTRDRPFRPLPSKRISIRHASTVGFWLLLVSMSVGLGIVPSPKRVWEAWPVGVLFLLILYYNITFKKTMLGPVVMGLCRGCNLMLGTLLLTEISYTCYLAAIINTVYITGVTVIASDETRQVKGWKLQVGVFLMGMSAFFLFCEALDFHRKNTPSSVIFAECLLGMFFIALIYLWVPAIKNPSLVGRGIKYSIMGLIVIDAIHVTLGVGYPGLLVLLLLIPALFLGRFIYST